MSYANRTAALCEAEPLAEEWFADGGILRCRYVVWFERGYEYEHGFEGEELGCIQAHSLAGLTRRMQAELDSCFDEGALPSRNWSDAYDLRTMATYVAHQRTRVELLPQ